MTNISGIIKSIRNIMRQDTGTGSDELRILRLGWMLFLKIFSDKDKELDALLDKYADEGIENIEDIKVLKVNPFDQFGTPTEIINLFGGKIAYQQALMELERQIYKQIA